MKHAHEAQINDCILMCSCKILLRANKNEPPLDASCKMNSMFANIIASMFILHEI